MIVGLLSDTHGDADMAVAAVRLLLEHGAEYLVHCGDVGTTAVLDAMAGHPAMFVYGNTDADRAELARYAQDLHIACGQEEGKLAFNGKLAVVAHGDIPGIIRRVLNDKKVDYLFVGHTHRMHDERFGKVRIINPGALHRAAKKTVAVLDTVKDQLEFLEVRL